LLILRDALYVGLTTICVNDTWTLKLNILDVHIVSIVVQWYTVCCCNNYSVG